MRVIFHPEAHAEMIAQAQYYENKSEGLGFDFLDAVEEATHRIGRSLKAGLSSEEAFAKDSFPDFLLRFFTKLSRIVFTSPP